MTSLNSGANIKIAASSGTITLSQSMTLSAGDELELTGTAKLVGETGVVLTINGTATVATSNFYTSAGDGTLASGTLSGAYTWTADCDSTTDGNQSGWKANA